MPKPPGLSPGQKAMVGFAIVATLLLTFASVYLLVWMNKATKDTGLQFDVFGDAKKRQAERRVAYNDAIAQLPTDDLPQGWSTASALKVCAEGDLDLAHIVGEILYTGGDRIGPLDLPYLAQMLEEYTEQSTIAEAIHPSTNAPDLIEQNLLQFLRDSEELAALCNAVRHGIYFIEIDPTVATWKHSIGDNAVPDRHSAAILLEVRALLEARWGTPQSALEAYLDATRFAELLGNDPYLSYHWMRYSVERRADIALWELIDKQSIDDDAMENVTQSLARRTETTRLKEVIIEDAVLEFPRSILGTDMNNPFVRPMAEMMGVYDPVKMRKIGETLARYVDLPYSEMDKHFGELTGDEHDLDVIEEALYARSVQLRSAFMAEVLPVALALKRYKAQTGAYPTTLVMLVPDYIESVPREPLSESPIKYMPWKEGFFLLAQEVEYEDDDDQYANYDSYYGYDYHDDESTFGDGYTDETLWHAES